MGGPPIAWRRPTREVSWLSVGKSTDPAFLDRSRDAIVKAAAVIACSDGPSSLARLLLDVCGDRVPLISCELTETGARLQIVTPREPGAGCATCDAAFRASRDVLEAAVYEYLDQPVFATVPWRYRHRADDLAIAARFVTIAIGNAISAMQALARSRTAARASWTSTHAACARMPSLAISRAGCVTSRNAGDQTRSATTPSADGLPDGRPSRLRAA